MDAQARGWALTVTGDNGSCGCDEYCATDWDNAAKKQRPHWTGATSAFGSNSSAFKCPGIGAGPLVCICVQATHFCPKIAHLCKSGCDKPGAPVPQNYCVPSKTDDDTIGAATFKQQELFVSPTGLDSATGMSKASPLRTLPHAQLVARELLKGSPGLRVTVSLLDGVFRLRKPLTLSTADSGSLGAPVTWRSHPDNLARARIAG